jgi:hypothetical protein
VLLAAFQASLTTQGFPPTEVSPPIGILSRDTDGTEPAITIEGGGQADDIPPAHTRTPTDEAAADWVPPPAGEFVPPEGWWCSAQAPDPGTDRPPELAGLTEEDLQPLITPPVLVPAAWPEGIVPPDGFPTPVPPTLGGPGFGFGQGDLLDLMPPGVTLAGLAEDAHSGLGQDAQGGVAGDVQGGLAGIDSDCLVGVIRAWRRITSWATGRELAAVAELARRYPADGLPGSGCEYVADELSAALTLTGRAAQDERDLAAELATRLPATLAALSAGRIDLARARVLANGTAELAPAHAAAVEAAVLPTAPGLTTGQLRAAVAKAVLAAGPGAADRQRDAAQARAHVACWTGQSGTAHLEGHDLPPAQTLAADARLGQIATRWKAQGAQGGMDLLRAHAYLALLLGCFRYPHWRRDHGGHAGQRVRRVRAVPGGGTSPEP